MHKPSQIIPEHMPEANKHRQEAEYLSAQTIQREAQFMQRARQQGHAPHLTAHLPSEPGNDRSAARPWPLCAWSAGTLDRRKQQECLFFEHWGEIRHVE